MFEVFGSNNQYKYDICTCAMHITRPICISILPFVYRIQIEIRTQKYKTYFGKDYLLQGSLNPIFNIHDLVIGTLPITTVVVYYDTIILYIFFC